jgi:tRNA A37 threonylcarbamoyladenosine dehydratase
MDNLYSRQKELKINNKQKIAVIGCGGIGFWVSKLLALSGVEKIYLYDNDIFEEHNLNRIDLPTKFIGRNKAEITKIMINQLRPECIVYFFPFELSELTFPKEKIDWLIDCTDKFKAQEKNFEISKLNETKYLKAGYDGENISIHNEIAEWGESEDGYTVTPSWSVPAIIVAALTVGKVLKYNDKELFTNIKRLYS